ncbi:MAG: hypothetical protein M1827_003630 [Pycnora praestabilis]|nr:MAG: hypothetical protein M1827_003630 [Pycnora praestabilis]
MSQSQNSSLLLYLGPNLTTSAIPGTIVVTLLSEPPTDLQLSLQLIFDQLSYQQLAILIKELNRIEPNDDEDVPARAATGTISTIGTPSTSNLLDDHITALELILNELSLGEYTEIINEWENFRNSVEELCVARTGYEGLKTFSQNFVPCAASRKVSQRPWLEHVTGLRQRNGTMKYIIKLASAPIMAGEETESEDEGLIMASPRSRHYKHHPQQQEQQQQQEQRREEDRPMAGSSTSGTQQVDESLTPQESPSLSGSLIDLDAALVLSPVMRAADRQLEEDNPNPNDADNDDEDEAPAQGGVALTGPLLLAGNEGPLPADALGFAFPGPGPRIAQGPEVVQEAERRVGTLERHDSFAEP